MAAVIELLERDVFVVVSLEPPLLKFPERLVPDAPVVAAERQSPVAVAEDHGIGPYAPLDHAVESIEHPLPRLALVVADQHVGHDMGRGDAVALQRVNAIEEAFLVADVVPGGVQAFGREGVVAIVDGCERGGAFVVDHADVDALVQADLEAAGFDFVESRLPLLARLAEEVVVEEMEVLRVGFAAPDVGDGVDGAVLALFLGYDAEAALEAAATLREADAAVEARIDRVVAPARRRRCRAHPRRWCDLRCSRCRRRWRRGTASGTARRGRR